MKIYSETTIVVSPKHTKRRIAHTLASETEIVVINPDPMSIDYIVTLLERLLDSLEGYQSAPKTICVLGGVSDFHLNLLNRVYEGTFTFARLHV